jgi:PST family polysaccharide transporter
MKDLRAKTIRGGAARLFAQAANFAIRLGSLMVLARLLTPKDFGLVGMVTAFTGVLLLFRDFGLSSATIQRADITHEQTSTLFWINMLVGAILGLVSLALAPAIAAFYHEPRLISLTAVLGAGFLINAASVQHGALLQRQMRFTALAVINTIALLTGSVIAIEVGKAGYGYWSLVAMAVASPLVTTVGCWVTSGWVPGMPRRQSGIRSMMHFGGTLTASSLLGYAATNFEKVLLGRFWGVEAIGIYGRAFQLINIPTDNLSSAAGEVAFAALSRLQNDQVRLRSYFLKGCSLLLAMTLPVTVVCALFAQDVILVFLGPKWIAAVPLFRLLAPTILVFAIIAPLIWLLSSVGKVGRLFKMSLVLTPFTIAGYVLALPYGPKGVAFAYSTVMLLWAVPAVLWALHGTGISFRDMLFSIRWPLVSTIVAGALAFLVRTALCQAISALPRLTLECLVMLAVYAVMLLFVAGEKTFYLNLLRTLRESSTVEDKSLASA